LKYIFITKGFGEYRMAQLSELKRGKVMKIAVLSMVLLMFTAMTITVASASAFHDWSSAIVIQDTDDTPGQRGPVEGPPLDLWYEDGKGVHGQNERELLYLYIDWDSTYLYVRWDVKKLPDDINQTYYVLLIDAVEPLSTAKENATHALWLEVDNGGDTVLKIVAVPYVSDAASILWQSAATENYDRTSITPTDEPTLFDNQTALETRFPWTPISGDGPMDIMFIRAETHSSDSSKGINSEVMDYIYVQDDPVPWFTDLGLTLLATTILAVIIKKKKIGLPVKIG
jgi:hypothetical protein